TPHSQLVAAADLGMHVTLLRPEGFGLEPEVVRAARARAESGGGSLVETDDAFFLHCLPVRRNVVVSDGVLDSRRSAVIDEAENRLWTAAAVFGALSPH